MLTAPGVQSSRSVPLLRLDNADPALLAELLDTVGEVAGAGAFTLGEHVEGFEQDFAAYCGTTHAIGVSSGTEALTLALRALGIGAGDEVLVPSNSFIATAEAVSATGAQPVLVDVDPATRLLTAEIVERHLGPRVRCVIPVHLFGATVDLDPILGLAHRAGIGVIEDACQAHGARYRGRPVGSLGDAGCFSFYPTKNLGAWGDGGAVVTERADVADRVRLLRSHGERPRYHHRVVGYTARLDALQAAVLRRKLERLEDWNEDRRRLGRELREGLADVGLVLPHEPSADGDHVHHLFVVESEHRDALREHLSQRGVASAVHYPTPIHRTDAYAHLGLGAGSLPTCERLAARMCSLPLFPTMSAAELEHVIESVREFAQGIGSGER